MPTVRRIRVKGLKGKYRVTLYGREGTYALSVPKSRLGYLLLPVARAHPFEVRLKSPVSVEIPRGVKPVGKAARKSLTYTPLRKTRSSKRKTAPVPKIEEVTSAVPPPAPAKKKGTKKGTRKAVATAA